MSLMCHDYNISEEINFMPFINIFTRTLHIQKLYLKRKSEMEK